MEAGGDLSKDNGELFVVVTRHISEAGREVTHTYGTWTQRKTAMKHKVRFGQLPGVEATTCKLINANPSS